MANPLGNPLPEPARCPWKTLSPPSALRISRSPLSFFSRRALRALGRRFKAEREFAALGNSPSTNSPRYESLGPSEIKDRQKGCRMSFLPDLVEPRFFFINTLPATSFWGFRVVEYLNLMNGAKTICPRDGFECERASQKWIQLV